jgi:hypothetical protein
MEFNSLLLCSRLMYYFLSQMNAAHTDTRCSFKICFNIIISSTARHEHDGEIRKTSDMCSGGFRFDSRWIHWLFWRRFLAFLSLSIHIPWGCLEIDHGHLFGHSTALSIIILLFESVQTLLLLCHFISYIWISEIHLDSPTDISFNLRPLGGVGISHTVKLFNICHIKRVGHRNWAV